MDFTAWLWTLVILNFSYLTEFVASRCNKWQNLESRGTFDEPSSHQPYLRTLTGNLLDCQAACMLMDQCRAVFFSSSTGMCIVSKWDKFSDGPTYTESSSATYSMFRKRGGFESCSNLKSVHSGVGNGEYWLYPQAPSFLGNAARLYCAEMNTQSPKEYLTLTHPNVGNFPNKFTYDCITIHDNMVSGCTGSNGITTFLKIGVTINSMEVVRGDMAYASASGPGPTYNYGSAYDCYIDAKRCDPIGTFVINTIGTGMIVSRSLTWYPSGYMGQVKETTRSQNGAVLSLVCGGWPGGCETNGPMKLDLNLDEVLSLLDCALQCMDMKNCYSFLYNHRNRSSRGLTPQSGTEYYTMRYGFGIHCLSPTDCSYSKNSISRQGSCQCSMGYSYQPSDGSYVKVHLEGYVFPSIKCMWFCR